MLILVALILVLQCCFSATRSFTKTTSQQVTYFLPRHAPTTITPHHWYSTVSNQILVSNFDLLPANRGVKSIGQTPVFCWYFIYRFQKEKKNLSQSRRKLNAERKGRRISAKPFALCLNGSARSQPPSTLILEHLSQNESQIDWSPFIITYSERVYIYSAYLLICACALTSLFQHFFRTLLPLFHHNILPPFAIVAASLTSFISLMHACVRGTTCVFLSSCFYTAW